MFVYLDNSATTRQYDEVTETMLHYMKDEFGNPSSLYRLGMNAEKALKESRKSIAKALSLGDVQVRKDLNAVCGTGKPKVGYRVSDLYSKNKHFMAE